MDLGVVQEEGLEERKAQEVVPVGVGEQEIVLVLSFAQEVVSQTPHAGASVHDNDITTAGTDL
jgi:hypothetical protein